MTRRSCRLAVITCVGLALAGGPAGAQISDEIEIHGFASQGYLNSSNYNYLAASKGGSMEYQEYAFNLSRQVSPDLRVGAQVFARDLGPLGDNQIELDWGFGDYRWRDELGFRAGRIKMPSGFYNETSDYDALRSSVLLPQGVYDLRLRDLMVSVNGVATYGSLMAGPGGSVEYQGYIGSVNVPNDGSVAQVFGDSGQLRMERMDADLATGGGLVWTTPLEGLRLGQTINYWESSMDVVLSEETAAALAPLGVGPNQTIELPNTRRFVSSLEFQWNAFLFASEYALWQVPQRHPVLGGNFNTDAWYVQGSYRLSDWFEVGSYYSMSYSDRDDRDGSDRADADFNGYQKDIAVSLRFDIGSNMIVKVEPHFVEGTSSLYASENSNLGDPAEASHWRYLAVKTSFLF